MNKIGPKALIVEGGAMRGIFSCGILDHFLDAQFSPFDSFWGVSAGASNLAAYLAKMPRRNLQIYLDYSLRKNFISPTQVMRGGHIMDLDWLWEITIKEMELDMAVLSAEQRPFFLGVTRRDNGKAEYHTPSIERLTDTMKASSALPILYRHGVALSGTYYVDGGVSDAIPIAEAIRRGATQIMVLRSRPASYRKSKGKFDRVMKSLLKRTPDLIEPMTTRHIRYNQAIELINNPPSGVKIIQVCPPEHFSLKRLTRNTEPLESAYKLGTEAGREAITRWQAL